MENADYVIDSICRQLRHLDLNPHVPNVLAAMLSYIGVAQRILPLLEEPVWQYILGTELFRAINFLIFLMCHEDSVFLYSSWKISFQLVCSTYGVVFLQILPFALFVFYHNLFSPKILNHHFLCIVPCVIILCKELNLMSFTTFGSNVLA